MRAPMRLLIVAWFLLPALGSVACGENAATPGAPLGCCFNPAQPEDFYTPNTPLPDWYDAIIHFESTRPTTLLPHRPPTTW